MYMWVAPRGYTADCARGFRGCRLTRHSHSFLPSPPPLSHTLSLCLPSPSFLPCAHIPPTWTWMWIATGTCPGTQHQQSTARHPDECEQLLNQTDWTAPSVSPVASCAALAGCATSPFFSTLTFSFFTFVTFSTCFLSLGATRRTFDSLSLFFRAFFIALSTCKHTYTHNKAISESSECTSSNARQRATLPGVRHALQRWSAYGGQWCTA